jgi:hypothetical protein
LLNVENNLIEYDKIKKTESLIVEELNYDLRNKNLTDSFNIKSLNSKKIHVNDIYKILRILNLNKTIIYASELGIESFITDGEVSNYLLKKLTPSLKKNYRNSSLENFQKIIQYKGIPDLGSLYLKGIIGIEDIIELRENTNGKKFRDWYFSKDYNNSDTVQNFLMNKVVRDNSFTKHLRWIIPNLISIKNPMLGVISSYTESFIIDKIFKGWQPNIFIDNHLKRTIDNKIEEYEEKRRKSRIEKRFPKIGRNDKCPCGSNKKFKKCCGK